MDNPPPYVTAGPKGDNLYEWVATLTGPPSTPYANGIFFVDITFPPGYPFAPPVLNFRTRIYHCNINSKGKVCIDKLNEDWTPALTIGVVLGEVVEILREPNCNDPLVGSIANEFIVDREKHDQTAREWTRRFAS